MTQRAVAVTYKLRDITLGELEDENPILGPNEPCVMADGPNKGSFKMGDGYTRFNDLLWFKPLDPNNVSDPELQAHIDAENPHQNFFNTEGVSLLLRYQNAKV